MWLSIPSRKSSSHQQSVSLHPAEGPSCSFITHRHMAGLEKGAPEGKHSLDKAVQQRRELGESVWREEGLCQVVLLQGKEEVEWERRGIA